MKIVLLILFVVTLESCATAAGARDCRDNSRRYTEGQMGVDVTLYSAENPSDKSILIMPPTGGKTILEKRYAADFCKAGFDVYILESWSGLGESATDLDLHQRLYGRGQQAISLVLTDVKSAYIGMLGTSVGGLHAAVAASYQPRLDAVFVITGGAPIGEVVVASDQKAMQELYEARKKRYGFTDRAENVRALEKSLQLEPMKLGDGYKKKVLGMAIATEDTTVPTESQRKLEHYWKPQTVIELSHGHFWGIVNTWVFHSKDVRRFFEESSAKTIANP